MDQRARQLDDLAEQLGSEIGTTDWFSIDQRSEDVFSFLTGDRDVKHNNPEWAKDSQWGTTTVHGLHLLSLIFESWKALDLPFATTEEMTPLYYGFDRVRFTAPLRVGHRARIALDNVTKRDDGSYLIKATHTHVEHHDLTLRMSMMRFTKLTNAVSKRIENHVHILVLCFAH